MSATIDISPTTHTLSNFHNTLMNRRRTEIEWGEFDRAAYTPQQLADALKQWRSRAIAEYASTAQFAQLLHRFTLIGAPIELVGAATRLAQDECRHADYCTRMCELLGQPAGTLSVQAPQLSLFDAEPDPWVAIYRTILTVCCFGETISVPVLNALVVISTDPIAKEVSTVIAADEEYHSRFGWETLTWLTPRLTDAQRERVEGRLPLLMGHFERVCGGSPQMLAELAGQNFTIEPEALNIGTMTRAQYAGIFYHALTEEIMPGLEGLGFDAQHAWANRLIPKRAIAESLELSTGRPGE